MTVSRFTTLFLSLIFCTLTGCAATMMQMSKVPEGFTLKEITKADPSTPFAVNGATYAAISEGNLKLVDARAVEDKAVDPKVAGKIIATGSATALAFSPDGKKLAAATPDGKGSILRLFDESGKMVGETTIPARVTAIAWRSSKEILATTLNISRYSFGSSVGSALYTWDGVAPPVAGELANVTVRAAIAKQPDETLYRSLNLAVSPYGDEIAYSTIKDPPLFNPYLSISTRHLETRADHEVGVTSLGSGGPIYTPDGESLIVGDAGSMTRRLTIPDGREINAWPAPGTYPVISRSGEYLFLDGSLYKDGREIAFFPKESRGAFLPDGSGLVLSYQDKLFLLSGLNDKPAPPLPADLDRILQLRRLRSTGLITEKEYRAQLKKSGKAPAAGAKVPVR